LGELHRVRLDGHERDHQLDLVRFPVWMGRRRFGGAGGRLYLVVSACLVAWRYFKPLERASTRTAATPAPSQTLLWDTDRQAALELLQLEDFAINLVVSQLLEDMVQLGHDLAIQSPPGPLRLGGEFSDQQRSASAFLEEVQRTLGTTMRYEGIRFILNSAESEAVETVRQIPLNQRPPDIDALDIREWAIIHYQAGHVLAYLERQKRVAREHLRQFRDKFLEFNRARQK
jgi:hypothetical protein